MSSPVHATTKYQKGTMQGQHATFGFLAAAPSRPADFSKQPPQEIEDNQVQPMAYPSRLGAVSSKAWRKIGTAYLRPPWSNLLTSQLKSREPASSEPGSSDGAQRSCERGTNTSRNSVPAVLDIRSSRVTAVPGSRGEPKHEAWAGRQDVRGSWYSAPAGMEYLTSHPSADC